MNRNAEWLDTMQTQDLNLEQLIRRRIDQQTWGKVHRLHAELAGDQLVICGSVRSHHVKQLALKAALDVLGASPSVAVVMNIQVVSANSRASHA
jgi:hypothetical protein